PVASVPVEAPRADAAPAAGADKAIPDSAPAATVDATPPTATAPGTPAAPAKVTPAAVAPAAQPVRTAPVATPPVPAKARSESLVQGVSGFLRKLILGEASAKASSTPATPAPATLASIVAAAEDQPLAPVARQASAPNAAPAAAPAPTTAPTAPAPAAPAANTTPVAKPTTAAQTTTPMVQPGKANAVLPAPATKPAVRPVAVPAVAAPSAARSTVPMRPVLAASRPVPPAAQRGPGPAPTGHQMAKTPAVRPVAAAAAASTHPASAAAPVKSQAAPAPASVVPSASASTAVPSASPATAGAAVAAQMFGGPGGAATVYTDETLLCGHREDLPTTRWANDSSLRYEPADHLIGALREAWQVGNKWRVPTHFELPQGKVVVDSSQGRVYTDFDRAQLAQLWNQPLARRPKTRTLNRQESREFDAVLAEPSNLLRLDQLLWRGGMLTSAGRLPVGVDPTRTVYLKHWPNFTRLERTPSAVRMAALWATRGASIIETAKLVNLPQRQVIAFYNGMLALDLITEDGGHIRRAQRKNQNRGLLTSLLGWLQH
ncbi:MAG: hypothetical protein RL375_4843, partial [Pseudomonadota bacterium]